MYEVEIEQFSGPYDLLLQLIQKKNLEITEVNLSRITDQFLGYIDTLEEVNSEELADFLVVATKLLYIKSRALLPQMEDDDDSGTLEKHLKMYKRFVEAADIIQALVDGDAQAFSKDKLPMKIEVEFNPPPSVNSSLLHEQMHAILKKLEPVVHLPRAIIEKTVSLKERVRQLQSLFAQKKQVSFNKIIKESNSRSDIIVSFLALLDLVNNKEIQFNQQNNFSEIELVHNSSSINS